MTTEFLDAESFGRKLSNDLVECSHFHVAVSYVRRSGIDTLLKVSRKQLEHSQIVTCTDFGITEPEALLALLDHGYRIRAFRNPGLHAKVWILHFDNQPSVLYLGSSNLSHSATSTNIEANARLMDTDAIGSAEKWFSILVTAQLTVDVDRRWIESYEEIRCALAPDQNVVPERIEDQTPNGTWFPRNGGKTFLTQGIIEDIFNASPSRRELEERIRLNHQVYLVLLSRRDDGKSIVRDDIPDATLNLNSMQHGAGRRQVREWISRVWGFNTQLSFLKWQQGVWEDWFGSTGRKFEDFQYEILVDLNDRVPTIWVRAKGIQ